MHNGMDYTLYEEFPNDENLSKIELINFPINLVIAVPNIVKFNQIKRQLKEYPQVKDVGYWPTLQTSEGYWMSPFSKREGLERVIGELEERTKEVIA